MSKKRFIPAIFLLGIGIFFLFFHGIEILSDYIAYQSTTVSLFPPEVTTDDRGVAIFAICCVCAFAFVVEPLVTAWTKERIRERRKKEKR